MKVFLREKKLTKGRRSLYLDFYPPIPHPETRKPTRREHLKLFIYEKPKAEIERDHNKETKNLGESLRSRRQLEIQSGYYGFLTSHNSKKSFTAFLTDSLKISEKLLQRVITKAMFRSEITSEPLPERPARLLMSMNIFAGVSRIFF